MCISNKEAIQVASIARNYNFNELLNLITTESNPRELGASLYHTILTLQSAGLSIKDHEGKDKNSDREISLLCKLMGALMRLNSEWEDNFVLVFHPRVAK